jgi:hypothetical protein
MPGFSDETETVHYVHPSWDEESYMEFKSTRDQTDKDKATNLSNVTKIDYDDDAALVARSQGEKYRADVEIRSPISPRTAFILTQLVGWHGPEFVLPANRKDVKGNPHPLAGRKVPITPYWVGKRDPTELEDVDLWLNLQYKAMTEDEVTAFRERRGGASGPTAGESADDGAPKDQADGLRTSKRPRLATV